MNAKVGADMRNVLDTIITANGSRDEKFTNFYLNYLDRFDRMLDKSSDYIKDGEYRQADNVLKVVRHIAEKAYLMLNDRLEQSLRYELAIQANRHADFDAKLAKISAAISEVEEC